MFCDSVHAPMTSVSFPGKGKPLILQASRASVNLDRRCVHPHTASTSRWIGSFYLASPASAGFVMAGAHSLCRLADALLFGELQRPDDERFVVDSYLECRVLCDAKQFEDRPVDDKVKAIGDGREIFGMGVSLYVLESRKFYDSCAR